MQLTFAAVTTAVLALSSVATALPPANQDLPLMPHFSSAIAPPAPAPSVSGVGSVPVVHVSALRKGDLVDDGPDHKLTLHESAEYLGYTDQEAKYILSTLPKINWQLRSGSLTSRDWAAFIREWEGKIPHQPVPQAEIEAEAAEAAEAAARPIRPRGAVSEADVRKKLEATPGAAWAIGCFDGCSNRLPCLIACTTDYESKGKGNKPDAATVDKAFTALPRILGLLDCIRAAPGGKPGFLLQCLLRPSATTLDQMPDADKKIDAASKTLDCAGACTGGNKGNCLLACLNKH